jgi:hypothetical protein
MAQWRGSASTRPDVNLPVPLAGLLGSSGCPRSHQHQGRPLHQHPNQCSSRSSTARSQHTRGRSVAVISADKPIGRRVGEPRRITAKRLETKDFAHGAHGYRYYGCRCDICRAGSTEAARKWRATHPRPSIRRPKPLVVLETPVASNPREIQHGTKNAYAYHGCRCELCTGAHTDAIYAAKDRRLQRAEAGMTFEHGLNGYRNYDCRCDICKAAKVEYARSKRSAA